MNKFARTLAGVLEHAEDMRGDICFRFDLETRVCNITVKLSSIGWFAEICIK